MSIISLFTYSKPVSQEDTIKGLSSIKHLISKYIKKFKACFFKSDEIKQESEETESGCIEEASDLNTNFGLNRLKLISKAIEQGNLARIEEHKLHIVKYYIAKEDGEITPVYGYDSYKTAYYQVEELGKEIPVTEL